MGLFKKISSGSGRALAEAHEPPQGDPRLPGTAGYRGVGRLPKNAMPISRFNFVRPDGRQDG